MGKGPLILLSLGLLFMILYFSIFGFSYNKPIKLGQYAGLAVISFCIIDEIFKEGD